MDLIERLADIVIRIQDIFSKHLLAGANDHVFYIPSAAEKSILEFHGTVFEVLNRWEKQQASRIVVSKKRVVPIDQWGQSRKQRKVEDDETLNVNGIGDTSLSTTATAEESQQSQTDESTWSSSLNSQLDQAMKDFEKQLRNVERLLQ